MKPHTSNWGLRISNWGLAWLKEINEIKSKTKKNKFLRKSMMILNLIQMNGITALIQLKIINYWISLYSKVIYFFLHFAIVAFLYKYLWIWYIFWQIWLRNSSFFDILTVGCLVILWKSFYFSRKKSIQESIKQTSITQIVLRNIFSFWCCFDLLTLKSLNRSEWSSKSFDLLYSMYKVVITEEINRNITKKLTFWRTRQFVA